MHYFVHFVAAALLVNAIPHLVKGVCGAPFQSPFASPPGVGLSGPVTNVLWGGINFVIGLLLLVKVGPFSLHDDLDIAATLAGGWVCAFGLALYFGRFHNSP